MAIGSVRWFGGRGGQVLLASLAVLGCTGGEGPGGGGVRSVEYELDGVRLHALVAGPQGGLWVLLLHGARFDAETWRATGTLALLAERGYHALAVDLPGHGGSPDARVDAAGFLPRLVPLVAGKRPVVLVAPSMSGRFALPALADHPELFAGFVGVAPVGVEEHAARLRGCRVPALLLWGGEDRVVPPAVAERLARLLPRSEKRILEGAGHPCYLDRTKEFHEALLAFLGGLED